MMNQTKKHTTSKKLLALLLALIMTVSLLPMSVFAAEMGAETPVVEGQTQQDAAPVQEPEADNGEEDADVQPAEDDADAADDGVAAFAADGVAVQTDATLESRIVHLDCGRKYFSVDYIKAVLKTMAENGFNQLELAFGNGGLRFVLDEMDIKSGDPTLHNSADVKAAILEGNKNFYDDPNGNALTETDMKAIITYANKVGVEIVPLLNMPGHMDGILGSSLFSQYKLSGSDGSLDLNNSDAVTFGKALLKLYVDWFKTYGNSNYFNFGADEYGQGIRNPYIESSVAKVTYNQLINYMNDCAGVIEGQSMVARCFNDFVCYNKRTTCNLYKTVQVCYWSNQWNGSEYNTPDVIQNAGYTMINTNQKWYFVPSKADEYGKSVVLSNFSTFDVTKYQNIKSGYNSTSTTYTEIPVGTTNVGAMFCVWCDTPSVDVALSDVQELIAAMADANPSYFTKKTVPEEPETPVIKQDDTTVSDGKVQVAMGATTTLTLSGGATATWSSSNEKILTLKAVSATRAAVQSTNAVQVVPVATGTATVTAELDDGTKLSTDVTVTAAPEKEKVYVTVQQGQTSDPYEQTGDYTGDYSDEYAEVTTTTKTETAGKRYESATLAAGTFYISNASSVQDNATLSQLTFESAGNGQYYIKNSNGQYVYPNATYDWWGGWSYSATPGSTATAVNVKENTNGSVTISRKVSWYGYTTTAYLTISNTEFSASGTSSNIYLYNQVNVPGGTKTSVTFKGLQLVTDRVYTIGNVEYHVTVTERDLSKETVDINLWITNGGVLPDGWSNGSPSGFVFDDQVSAKKNWTNLSYRTVSAAQYGFHSEKGAELKAILDGTLIGTAANRDPVTVNVEYWKSAYHDSSVRQEYDGWTNHSEDGIEIKYLRYWDDTWAYSVDGKSWVAISDISATEKNKNQLAIFYRQPTTITDEVQTKVVDWGPIDFSANQSLLDFAVKYETGEKTPTSFPVNKKTIGFNCPTDQPDAQKNGYVVKDGNYYYRVVHGIAGVETSNYEVYMITLTPSNDSHGTTITSTSSYTYAGTEKVAWAKTEADAENSGLPLVDDGVTTVTYGGEPYLSQVKIYQKQGLLVTYYVRAKVTADSLTVHYINKTLNNTEFYSYNIAVAENTKFKDTITLATPDWKTYLVGGEVTNIYGREQRITADLSQMPEIDAKYRYAIYTCENVERRDDKNVYLYYVFSNETSFVVDFGLNLVIPLSRLSEALNNATIQKVTVSGAKCGKTVYDTAKKQITYQPTKTIDDVEKLSVEITGKIQYTDETGATVEQESTVSFLVNIIPASTVYYEDSFATFYDAGSADAKTAFGASTGADKMGQWYVEGTEQTAEQALEELGKKDNVYGYDPVYNNSTTFSMGSAKKVTVNANTYKENNSSWPTATFTFKGTGFDVISLTSNTSGTFFVTVTNKKTGDVVRKNTIDTYYGYHQDKNGNWVAEANNPNTLYQIPVMKIKGLEYAEYDVEIKVAYASFLDHTSNASYSFWLDAIRVYDPMGKGYDYTGSDNKSDNETNPGYVELRQVLVDANSLGTGGAVFIDGNANETSVATYANYGPNHEVYLATKQAIGFKLIANQVPEEVQLAAKQLTGNTANLTVTGAKIGRHGEAAGNTLELVSGTDEYYELSGINWTQASGSDYYETDVITLMNSGESGIVALTNLKLVNAQYVDKRDDLANAADDEVLVTMAMDADIAQVAVAAVDSVLHPQEVKTFTPERFEASWNRSSVRVGEKATLTVKTSEDVEAITVDGVTIDTYRTRTQRTGWGWNAKKVTYREFTYTITASEAGTLNCSVAAINAEGTASEAITATLTVQAAAQRPGWGGWFGNLFSRWF